MLWIGAIAFVFYLYHVVLLSYFTAAEITIGGILLFTTTYSLLKDLKTETGVTSKPDHKKTNAF
jgi:hypothetical protein